MKSYFWIVLIAIIAWLAWVGYADAVPVYVDVAVVIAIFAGAAWIMPGSGKACKTTKNALDGEYKEFESAKTSNPEGIAKDQIKWYGERTGTEFFGNEKPKEPDPIAGIAKGFGELIKVSKKLFKK